MANIIDREEINLSPVQLKMIERGWGKETVESTTVEKIVYRSDGLKIKGYIAYPKYNTDAKFPCIIWNRGGYKERGYIDEFNAKGIFGQIASWGYVVFASMYRGSIENNGTDELGGKDLNDILTLYKLAENFPFADRTCWGIEGWSRGGMMTYLALKENKQWVIPRCAVLISPISDLVTNLNFSAGLKNYFDQIGMNSKKELESRSAIHWVDKLPKQTNYLLIHGSRDEIIPVQQTLDIAKKFSENNLNYRLTIFEQGDHFLKKFRKEVSKQCKDWYKKWLG